MPNKATFWIEKKEQHSLQTDGKEVDGRRGHNLDGFQVFRVLLIIKLKPLLDLPMFVMSYCIICVPGNISIRAPIKAKKFKTNIDLVLNRLGPRPRQHWMTPTWSEIRVHPGQSFEIELHCVYSLQQKVSTSNNPSQTCCHKLYSSYHFIYVWEVIMRQNNI